MELLLKEHKCFQVEPQDEFIFLVSKFKHMLRKEALKGESEDKSHVLLKEGEVSSQTRRDAEPRKWEISFLCATT